MVRAVPGGQPLPEQVVTQQTRPTLEVGAALRASKIALLLAPAGLIVALCWPMLFSDATLAGDWARHLFLVWSQSRSISADHHPSLFLSNSHSVLYPQYAFYGGTLYAIAGTISLLLGDAPIAAYVLTYLLGFAAAYGGWYWLARASGLTGWRAQAPGLVFITSAYYLTLIYERGDWSEFMTVSMIPLLVASGISVLRAESLHPWPAVALLASTVVFTGGHLLTLLWGTTCIAVGAVLALAFIREARTWLVRKRVLRLVGLVTVSTLVNAWFLLPLLAYHGNTRIGVDTPGALLTLRLFMQILTPQHLFGIERVTAVATQKDFALNLPTLTMAWSAVATAILLPRRLHTVWARMLIVCAAMATLTIVLMTHLGLLLALPGPFTRLEFSYRLESYVLLWVSGTVLCALVSLQGHRRRAPLTAILAPLLAFGVLQAVDQVDAHTVRPVSRQASIGPNVESGPRHIEFRDFMDGKIPMYRSNASAPEVYFPAAALHDDRASVTVHLKPGQRVYTNVGGGPEMVQISGARIFGTSQAGNDLIEVGPGKQRTSATRGPRWTEVISVRSAGGPPIVLGRYISLAAIALLLALFALLAARTRHARRRGRRPRADRERHLLRG